MNQSRIQILSNTYEAFQKNKKFPISFLKAENKNLKGDIKYLIDKGFIECTYYQNSCSLELTSIGIDYVENGFQDKNEIPLSNITFSIENVNAPSIIGTQHTATLNNTFDFEQIRNLIQSTHTEDQEILNELTSTVQSIVEQNRPLTSGIFSRFGNALSRNPEFAVAIWGTIHTFLLNKLL